MNIKRCIVGTLLALGFGLMSGVSAADEKPISPDEKVSVAQMIAVTSRVFAENCGDVIPEKDGEWYEKYVSYAVLEGFIEEGQFDDYTRPAKRYEMAHLMKNAMPDGYYGELNDISDVPDVPENRDFYDEILTLYKAGVLTGTDAYGNFFPENDVMGYELETVINRAVFPEKRIEKAFDIISDDDAYPMCLTSSYSASKEGICSGWLYDGRGSAPRTSLFGSYGSIIDISEESGSAYIREFNKTSTGKLLVQTSVSLSGYDGAFLEFRNDKNMSVFRLETVDGDWYMLKTDGSYDKVYEIGEFERGFAFEISLDLDNNRAEVWINYTNCGTFPLITSGEDTNIFNFRFATTEESKSAVSPGRLYIHGNYSVIEYFIFNNGEELPIGWNGENAYEAGERLFVKKDGYAAKSFDPVSDTVIAETMFFLPEREHITYALKSCEKVIAEFTTDDSAFYVNGEKVYENYYANLWYRLRLEANTDTGEVLVKINGKNVKTVEFAEEATSADNIYLSNSSETTAEFDDIKVYRTYEREDYVPAPVVPDGEEKYIVGMNVCSLWQNGNHFGWHCITPYDDPQPVLGYYDEGLAETADWELKYIIEHGIDFQAFCIYANSTSGPQRYSATHLYDGFMNAKYSDMSKFCVIWETANAQSPSSFDAWKNHYVPYFIEYYFKDPRHIVIDNKPLLCVFGANKLPDRLNGTNADVKECFDYLEQEVKKLGFDGMIYLACGTSNASLAEMGFDGCYAYNWGNYGYQYNTNIININSSASNKSVYTVPTISVGFNSIPWHGIRYPMMSKEDFAKCQKWVKEEYLTKHPTEKWQENFVMLSTWNEYGEGTYMMPTTDEKGFQYLDVIREAYTDEKEDASINTVPSEEQKYRINRLYPQYRRLLRKEGYVTDEIDTSTLESVFTIDYSKRTDAVVWSVSGKKVDSNGISGVTAGDAIIMINNIGADIDASEIVGLKIKTKIPEGTRMQVFFVTEENKNWSESMAKIVPAISANTEEYYVLFNNNNLWKGKITGLRIDPVSESGQPFTLKSAEFLKAPYMPPKAMIINGLKYTTNFYPEKSVTGDTLVAFDPATGLDFRLNIFHEWSKDNGELVLNFPKKVMKFTVGSDKYTVNGVEKSLGYSIYEIDGLPMLPINKICEAVGYSMKINDEGIICIDTDQRPYFDMISLREKGKWDFNFPGDTEGWASSFMSLRVMDGHMACESASESTDPTILFDGGENFEMLSSDYTHLEFRVRYKYTASSRQPLTMYFITDKNSTWSEYNSIKAMLNGFDSNGEWETYTVDLTELSQWKDTITDLRFDPFNGIGMIDVDYIIFY